MEEKKNENINETDEKNGVNDIPEPEDITTDAHTPKKTKKEKKFSINVFIIVSVSIFLSVYLIINIETLAGLAKGVAAVLLPVFLGGAIAFILNPLFRMLELKAFRKIKNKHLLRALSLIVTYLAALAVIAVLLALIIPSLITSLTDLIKNLPDYIDNASAWINDLAVNVTGNTDYATLVDSAKIKEFLLDLFSSGDAVETIGDTAVNVGSWLVESIKNILLAFFISIYVLLSKEKLKAQGKKLCAAMFTGNTNGRIMRYVYLTNKTFSTYFIGMVIDAVIVGIVTFIAMMIFGVPYAPLVAVTVGITNIIPIFGPFIGAIPSFLIIFIADQAKAFLFVILILVIQQIDGNIIAPRIHGNSTGLSSLSIIITIIIMGDYFGIVGMIIGVPFAAVLITIITEFLDHRLEMKGRPTDTAAYFEKSEVVNPYEHHENAWQKTFRSIGQKIQKCSKVFSRKCKSSENAQENNKENTNK
ncbi:MAG: AI-2E family transporter [Clostridia bacterium]|nr:AI-2E family transporter [Clostridia bacterium]